MASNTNSKPIRHVLVVAVTALLVASTVAAGVSLAAVGTAGAQTAGVSECTTIDEPGVYELVGDVNATEADLPCITITASDVTLDGDGHTVGSTDTSDYDPLVVADGSDDPTNVTVRDVRLHKYAHDVLRFDGVSNGRIADVDVAAVDVTNPTGDITVVGDGNTVTGLTGPAHVSVVGDDNRIVDTGVEGLDNTDALTIDGDGNLARNVTAHGLDGIVVSGADNRVENGSFDGVSIYYGARLENTTGTEFVDNTVTGEEGGLLVADSTGASVVGNEIDGDLSASLDFENGSDNTVHTNRLVGPVGFDENSTSNLVYDNYIESSYGYLTGVVPSSNALNVTPHAGGNVVGGDTIAGNYYANPDDETGFSRACEDADRDDLCDSAYELDAGITDHAPLADPTVDVTPVVDARSPTDPDGDGRYEDVDGDGRVTYSDVVVFFERLGDAAVRDAGSAYDFDRSGDVSYNDVVALLDEI